MRYRLNWADSIKAQLVFCQGVSLGTVILLNQIMSGLNWLLSYKSILFTLIVGPEFSRVPL